MNTYHITLTVETDAGPGVTLTTLTGVVRALSQVSGIAVMGAKIEEAL